MQSATSTEFEDEPKPQTQPPVDQTHASSSGSKLNQNFYQRTRTTILMIGGFIIVLCAGQVYTAILVQILNIMVFSQINSIKRNEEKEENIPMTKFINWYIFFSFNYYAFGNFVAGQFPILGLKYEFIGLLLSYHNFISFTLILIGFLSFVISLKQGYLKYQFRLFGWIVIAVCLVCYQAWLMTSNIFQGMIWYLIPALLVIINDIFAYLFGYFLGKHQLIALSPKKTWEGYIGGAVSTCLFSIILTEAIQSIPGLLCPSVQPIFVPFQFPSCDSIHLTNYQYGPLVLSNVQFHMMIFSLFASIIGPFGGFFASGLKRSIKIKDFGNVIPGHGGVSDRMDCQVIMGSFVYFYYHAFIITKGAPFSSYIMTLLTSEQQLQLYQDLSSTLISKGMLK